MLFIRIVVRFPVSNFCSKWNLSFCCISPVYYGFYDHTRFSLCSDLYLSSKHWSTVCFIDDITLLSADTRRRIYVPTILIYANIIPYKRIGIGIPWIGSAQKPEPVFLLEDIASREYFLRIWTTQAGDAFVCIPTLCPIGGESEPVSISYIHDSFDAFSGNIYGLYSCLCVARKIDSLDEGREHRGKHEREDYEHRHNLDECCTTTILTEKVLHLLW